MSAPLLPHELPYPHDLIRAVAVEADRDADRVITFLRALGLDASTGRPRHLPPAFLLAVGPGLRLLAWEANGYTAHTDAGLPDARTVLRDTFLAATTPERLDPRLPVGVLAVFVERFAWAAREALGADVMLGDLDPDGESAAEAVAEFLWTARHTASDPQGG